MISAKRSAAWSSASSQLTRCARRSRRAQFGMQQAILGARRQVQRGALGAQAAEVGRMVGVAAHA
jgi:hypothetical protein